MALSLIESFNNIKLVCDEAAFNAKEHAAVYESLDNIAKVLQEHDQAKAAKAEKAKKTAAKKPPVVTKE